MLFGAKAVEHRLSLKRNQARMKANMRLKQNKMNDFIKLVPPLTFSQWGLFIHARRLFIGLKCPHNYYKFREYSP
jgi:hypothetical protein